MKCLFTNLFNNGRACCTCLVRHFMLMCYRIVVQLIYTSVLNLYSRKLATCVAYLQV